VGENLNVTWMGVSDTPGEASGVAVKGSFAYVADGSSGLRVIDVSNPAAPQARGYYDTPGWATDIDLSGNYAFVADFDFGVRIIDITSPDAPTISGYFTSL